MGLKLPLSLQSLNNAAFKHESDRFKMFYPNPGTGLRAYEDDKFQIIPIQILRPQVDFKLGVHHVTKS